MQITAQSVTSLDKQCRYMHKVSPHMMNNVNTGAVSPHLISNVDSGTKCHLTR